MTHDSDLLKRVEDTTVETTLRRRVAVGFTVAVLLTGLVSLLSWRNAQQAAAEADLVAHTYAVLRTLEATPSHLMDVDTGGRAFALSGHEPYLSSHQTAIVAVAQDLQALRRLTADNPNQQRRCDTLGSQVQAKIEASEMLVAARRQTNAIPADRQLTEGEQLMDAVRATVQQMKTEEEQLLKERSQKTHASQRLTILAMLLGSFLGSGFLVTAGFAISREIGVSARARAQVIALNADLERRVEQRTAALGESEGRLASVIQSATDSIITVDGQQCIVLFNAAAEKMFRCSAAEVLGQPLLRLIPQRFHAAHGGHIRKFGETGVNSRAMSTMDALWAVRADGQEFQIEASISQVEAGGKKLFTVILRDVTERVQADAALQESLATSQRALKELADQKFALDQHAIVAVTDVQGTITYVNDKFCAISKYSKDELIGRNHRILNSGHHPKEFFQQMYRTIANGEVWHAEIKNRAKDGSIYWVDTTIVPTLNAQGKPRQYVAIRTDITERVQTEEIRERLAAVVESTDDAIIGKTLDGTITAWNSGAEKLFGYSSSEALGKPMRMLLPPERANEESDILARIGRGEGVDHFETVRVRKDGKNIDISATISPMRDSSGVIVGASNIARDITDRKLAEKEIRKLNDDLEQRVTDRTAQLEEANKELESFTYSVAHDLRAPLRHIAGFSGILVEEFSSSLNDQARGYLQRIQEGTRKMGVLVDELLSLARVGRQEPNMQQVGLNSIVMEVIGMLQPEIEGRQVEWKIAALPFVECDPTLVKQVFQNLISNSLKYSRPRPLAVIEIGQSQKNGHSAIFVRDNGVGFSMKFADKLFGVFQRLHRPEDFEGTGVGLATVQRIIKKHQGRVWAEAELDKGATFYFTIGGLQPAETTKQTAAMGA